MHDIHLISYRIAYKPGPVNVLVQHRYWNPWRPAEARHPAELLPSRNTTSSEPSGKKNPQVHSEIMARPISRRSKTPTGPLPLRGSPTQPSGTSAPGGSAVV